MSDRPYTVSEAAAALHWSEYLTRQAIKTGVLEAYRINRTVRIRPESVARLRDGEKPEAAA